MRTLNGPDDIDAYPDNKIVGRAVRFAPDHPQAPNNTKGGWVKEAEWGVVYEDDGVTVKYPAEAVSFAEQADGSWHKSTALRLN